MKIIFILDMSTYSLKVYCNSLDLSNIIKSLHSKLEKIDYYDVQVSYRGKNLNKVKEIIEQKMNEIEQKKDNQ